MSDDSFFREVNEDLRSERLKSFWDRFGAIIVGAVVLVILATAGWVGYRYWQTNQASQSGDAFLEALTLAREGDTDAALEALGALESDGFGAYPVLARMRAATLRAEAGDYEAAIDDFAAIGEDGSVPVAVRDAARLRAGYLIVDHGSYDEALAIVNALTDEDNAMRHSAREILGLSAYRADDLETAEEWFAAIAEDSEAAQGSAQRAEIMLELIAAYDPDGAEPAEDATPADDAETPVIPAPGAGPVPPAGDDATDAPAPASPELAPLEPLTPLGE